MLRPKYFAGKHIGIKAFFVLKYRLTGTFFHPEKSRMKKPLKIDSEFFFYYWLFP